jgi:hypothetical protein
VPIDDLFMSSQIPSEEYRKNIRELFEGLFSDTNIEKKSDLEKDEAVSIVLMDVFSFELKNELNLPEGFKTIYDSFSDSFMKKMVSLNRRGRREAVEILKQATPIYDEEKRKKGSLRRLI